MKKNNNNSHYDGEFDDLVDISEMNEYSFGDIDVDSTNRYDDYSYDEKDDEEY